MSMFIVCLIAGIVLLALGIVNFGGFKYTINSHTGRRVSEEDKPAYARVFGLGTMLLGICMLLEAGLGRVMTDYPYGALAIIGCILCLGFMAYGQFRYAGGIFGGRRRK